MSQVNDEIILTENPDKYSTLEIFSMLTEAVYNIAVDLLLKKDICIYKNPRSMRREDLELMLKEQSSFSYLLKALAVHNATVPLYLKLLLESVMEIVVNNGSSYHSFKSIKLDLDMYKREISLKMNNSFHVYKLETELQALASNLNEEEILNLIDILKHYEIK